jgi:hypothetical protein
MRLIKYVIRLLILFLTIAGVTVTFLEFWPFSAFFVGSLLAVVVIAWAVDFGIDTK